MRCKKDLLRKRRINNEKIIIKSIGESEPKNTFSLRIFTSLKNVTVFLKILLSFCLSQHVHQAWELCCRDVPRISFQISCQMFILPYWYIYLLDKTTWNNHSHLYGLIATLFAFTQANYSFSLDSFFNPKIKTKAVPLWNYIIILFQFFVLYFYAGIKKIDPDWIGGYSMSALSLHWVFNPFRFFLSSEQIDFWIVHIFGFVFDLTVGFLLLTDRPVKMLFSAAFYLMNSCMFHIGQFPYVCLVTIPIFCNYDWPDQFKKFVTRNFNVW